MIDINGTIILVGVPEETDDVERLSLNGMIILKRMLNEHCGN